ncbi:hypothetical protein PybrP1_010645 [[Pythium] brassicae (nom. inval.)]|nr:hypothetical protein PybrP1_010645 [[Pythium] brassicae (nom. inval.)]
MSDVRSTVKMTLKLFCAAPAVRRPA